MVEPNQLIPHITDVTKNWAVRVTVVESIPTLMCNNGAKLKRYVLTDKEGNEVVASIYGDDVDILNPMIKLFGVYDISNATVKLIEQKYRILPNPYQWNIRRQTFIRIVPEATPMLTHFLDTITPFSKITEMTNSSNSTVDIMGIIIDVDEVKLVNHGQNSVQHFVIIDLDKIPLRLSLWDDMIKNEGHTLMDAAAKRSIIVAKRLAIKTYNSISLAFKNSSSFTIDPPLSVVRKMKSWFSTMSDSDFKSLKSREATTFMKDLVTSGKMQTSTLSDIVNNATAGDYWVIGYLHLVDEDQKLYYVACSRCLRKINADFGVQYTCFVCKKNVVTTLRLLVILMVADQTDKVEIIAVSEVAEQLLNTTIEDMMNFYQSGQKFPLDPIKAKLHAKPFLMLLRRTTGSRSDTQRRLILISYHAHSSTMLQCLPSTNTKSSELTNLTIESSNFENTDALSLSPLKRQMSEVAITYGKSSKRQLTMATTNEEDLVPSTLPHTKQE